MSPEFDEQLCEEFPLIFQQRNDGPSKTAMCWGFEVGDGWYPLLNILCTNIQRRIDNRLAEIEYVKRQIAIRAALIAGDSKPLMADFKWVDDIKHHDYLERMKKDLVASNPVIPEPIPQAIAVQVKEKFGALRFYINGGDNIVYSLIQMAEDLSSVTCEVCGAPGMIAGKYWLRCLCPTHRKEQDKKDSERDNKRSTTQKEENDE